MRRFYEFPYENLSNVVFLSDVFKYQSTLKIGLPLVRLFLGDSTLAIELIQEGEALEFLFKSSNAEVKMKCKDDMYFIYYKEMIVGFSYDFSDGLLYEIKSYTENYGNKMYVEKFSAHSVDILIASPTKQLELIIPLDTDRTIDTSIFSKLEDSDDIEELKKFYFSHFFDTQTKYDKGNSNVLRIFRLLSDSVYLTDELVLQDGFISSYLVSVIQDGFMLSVKKPKDGFKEFVFNEIPKSDVNINDLARKLENKAAHLNFRL